ncbi:MAG: helix-turn-helix domain-containing protein, partial [Lachnospiraceae bacterium]|nr:helix-turn-helix domain-containing protein [Lachnospiraceae bacterium]
SEYASQAEISLEYCLKFNDSRWYISFSDIALDYILDTACPKQDLRYIGAPELYELMAFDRINQSELFKTLHVYLNNDRNTVKTSKDLYIGRSTLFYRLRKIQEITGLDQERLSSPDLNLYLRLSFYLLERSNTRKSN